MSVTSNYYENLEDALKNEDILCNDISYYSLVDGYLGDYMKPHLRVPDENGPCLLGNYFINVKNPEAQGEAVPFWISRTITQSLTSQGLLEHRRARPRYIQFRTGIAGTKCRHIQYPLSVPVNTADAIEKLSLKFNDFFYIIRGLCNNFRFPPLITSERRRHSLYDILINISTPSLTNAAECDAPLYTDRCWFSTLRYILESLSNTYYTLIEGILGIYNFTVSAKTLTSKPRISKAVGNTLLIEEFVEKLLAAMSLQEMALYTSIKYVISDLDSEVDKDITELYYKVYPSGECPEWLKRYDLTNLRKAFNIYRDGDYYHGAEGAEAYDNHYNSPVKYEDIFLSVAQALVLCYNIVRSLNADIYKVFFANTEPGKFISNEVKTGAVPTTSSINEYLFRFYWGQQVTMIAIEKMKAKLTIIHDSQKNFYVPDVAYVLSNPFVLNFIHPRDELNSETMSSSPSSTRRLRVMERLYNMDTPDCDRLLMANMLVSNSSTLNNTTNLFDSRFVVHRLDAGTSSDICEEHITRAFSDYKIPEHARFGVRLLSLFAFWYNTNIGHGVIGYTDKIAINTRIKAIQYDNPDQVDLEKGWIKHPTLDDIYSKALRAKKKEVRT